MRNSSNSKWVMTMNKKEIKTYLYRRTRREIKNYVNWGRTREKEQTINSLMVTERFGLLESVVQASTNEGVTKDIRLPGG